MNPIAGSRGMTIHCRLHDRVEIGAGDVPLRHDQVHVWFLPFTIDAKAPDQLLELLVFEERGRADRFVFEKDRRRFILGHALLRILLSGYLSVPPLEIEIRRGEHGKPFVEGSDVFFNLSDTKDAIAIGFTRDRELGIDVETLTRRVDHRSVSAHYFTPPEVNLIERAGNSSKRRFLELWTRKEAVLKASGVGIMEDLHSLRVDGPINQLTIRHEAFVRMAEVAYHVDTFAIGKEHIVSTALGIDREVVILSAWERLEQWTA
ncbi:MAG: 4'-phosphopantetheinyl transferase superfamily protein [Flavobacteriales bacterium]|nr:4'-phosphopantetheinyl transferase superfamily protein [Flavobacteriales bacterium]